MVIRKIVSSAPFTEPIRQVAAITFLTKEQPHAEHFDVCLLPNTSWCSKASTSRYKLKQTTSALQYSISGWSPRVVWTGRLKLWSTHLHGNKNQRLNHLLDTNKHLQHYKNQKTNQPVENLLTLLRGQDQLHVFNAFTASSPLCCKCLTKMGQEPHRKSAAQRHAG